MALGLQYSLFPNLTVDFPSTRYQGSKAKLVDWIWEQIVDLHFTTCLDAFSGTGAVAYKLKKAGKQVTCNDLLRFNYYIGRALIENSEIRLSPEEVEWLLARQDGLDYPTFVQDTFSDIYFTDVENSWIDQTLTNIRQFRNPYKFALAFFALCQACIIKRPYNLFHRKNLYVRFADVERSFGNKTTWDRPFDEWFRHFVDEANHAVFDNGYVNRGLNVDVFEISGHYDLVYIDTPYISKHGVGVDYRDFYHFWEGLTIYDEWSKHVDPQSKHRRLLPQKSDWTDKKRIYSAVDRLFRKFADSHLVVSYRSDGIPSESDLIALLKKYKRHVRVEHYGQYKYVLSTNGESKEVLLIGT